MFPECKDDANVLVDWKDRISETASEFNETQVIVSGGGNGRLERKPNLKWLSWFLRQRSATADCIVL